MTPLDAYYTSLVHAAADSIRETGMVDLVTASEAASAGYSVSTLTADAAKIAVSPENL